jgi:predicted negative regulator of RcsB-dependent stress response
MSHYDDEAQVEQLKQWWNENWVALAAGLVIGLGGIWGWSEWQNAKARTAEKASQIYEDLRKAAPDQMAGLADNLQQDYAATPYASHGALLMAEKAAEKNDWPAAQQRLEWVVKHADDYGLVEIARLRLARVLWQQNKPDEALTQLDVKDDDAFAALYQELRGDIKLSQGDKGAARAAYQKALSLGPAPASREFLQRKLDDLPGEAAGAPAKPQDKKS